MHHDITEIGTIIRMAREAKGMTREALAEATGASVSTIANIEKNSRSPKYDLLRKIVRNLDMSAELLFWPDRVESTEQEWLIRALHTINERDKKMFYDIARAFIHNAGNESSAKKTDGY